MKSFNIKKICTEPDRPPYSGKVDEYFEDFVYSNILIPHNIIINDEWKVILSIMIFRKEEGSSEGVSFYEPDVYEDEKVKAYPVVIHLEDIYKNDHHMENIIGTYFQIISLFLLRNYNVVKQDFMMSLQEKLDWEYLLSLPYPANHFEQGYLNDGQ